jgi:hypothetical protein
MRKTITVTYESPTAVEALAFESAVVDQLKDLNHGVTLAGFTIQSLPTREARTRVGQDTDS